MGVQILEGSSYQMLRIRNTYYVWETAGFFGGVAPSGPPKLIENVFYYGPQLGVCGGPQWSAGQKQGLVTYSTGLTYGGVTYYGFQNTVALNLNALLSTGAIVGGIFAKWIDVPTDFDQNVSTFVPATVPPTSSTVGTAVTNGGTVAGTRMPLDNHITMRKFTGVAGKEWSRGRWKFCPIAESVVAGDAIASGSQAGWQALKGPLYSPITDGTSTGGVPNLLYPCLVSTKLSQLRRYPTRVMYAPLIAAGPGYNYLTGIANPILNVVIGEQKRRKERVGIAI